MLDGCPAPEDVAELERMLSEPTPGVVESIGRGSGDIAILGVAGKMGPTLAMMARRAADKAGVRRKVIGVSRFSNPEERDKLDAVGIETIAGDLLDEEFVACLPDAGDVVYMAGMKFGATGSESLTWAMNTLLPAAVCKRYARSRIAAFSTGNVYPFMPLDSAGSVEADLPDPRGEYAMSCLGRERTFEHYSQTAGTPVSILRLNYACELRYGVLVDLAKKIIAGEPIDVSTPAFNVIWQRDANAMALASLDYAASPAFLLNLAGPEQLLVRPTCERLAARMNVEVTFTGEPADNALLSNGAKSYALFGMPTVTAEQLIESVAAWVKAGGPTLGKPTKFEVRDGRF